MLAQAVSRGADVQPLYVRAGFAWEAEEEAMARRFLATTAVRPMKTLTVDMREVYPDTHWALRGDAPGFDTPDADVYLEGRNIVLLSKAAIFMARIGSTQILIGPLAGNPFPDASRAFFDSMERALTLGLAAPVTIEAPLATMAKPDVIRLGQALGVAFDATLSCMQPQQGAHCGRCSKCRERWEAFKAAGIADPARYLLAPRR